MSNVLSIQLTTFANINSNGRVIENSYGYRIYDDYASVYNNTFDTLDDLLIEVNDENFWKVLENHDEFCDVDPLEEGVCFNGEFFSGEEIAEIEKEVERRTVKRIED